MTPKRLPLAGPAHDLHLLAGFDTVALSAWLVERGLSNSTARSAALRVMALAFGAQGSGVLSEESLKEKGVGRAARALLLTLSTTPSLSIHDEVPAEDGTVRLVLRARDGALIESVLIPGPARTTLCISSQVGCARACTFCETGTHGLTRQLSAAEIVDEVRLARGVHAKLSAQKARPPLSNLVLMGMGEPFDNLGEVLRALAVLTDPAGLAMAPSRITVSTVGVVDKLDAFFAGTRAELAVSLNAPDDERRSRIMPINDRVPLAMLFDGLRRAVPAGRRVLFEYVLFAGFNDAIEDADRVAALMTGIRARINVIPANPGPDPQLVPPSPERLSAFVARLAEHGLTTLVRRPRGRDVGGACGQLAGARRLNRAGGEAGAPT